LPWIKGLSGRCRPIKSQEAVTASCCVGVAVTLAAFEKRKAVIVAGRLALRLQAFAPRLMPRSQLRGAL
jgi:hypothetical protein